MQKSDDWEVRLLGWIMCGSGQGPTLYRFGLNP